MYSLILKRADDGTYCLFVWDSSVKTVTQIAEGKICNQLDKYGSRFLLGNKDEDLQVYAVTGSELQVIPVHCRSAEFIDNVCIYKRGGAWYGFVGKQEVLLGRRYRHSLSLGLMCRSERIEFDYFIAGDETKDYVLSIFCGANLIQGRYYGELLKEDKDYIFAKRQDGNYDIYTSEGLYVYSEGNKKAKKYFRDRKRRVYFWDEAKTSWYLAAEKSGICTENAFVVNYEDAETKQLCGVLFEVSGVSLKEKARGRFKVCRDGSFEIDGVIYSIDYGRDCVDFENARYSCKRKIKSLLGK